MEMEIRVRHLQKRNGKYYFRLNLPAFLQERWKIKEIHKSLKTDNLHKASRVCILLTAKADKIFQIARSFPMNRDTMKQMLDSYFNNICSDSRSAVETFGIDCSNLSDEQIASECRNLADKYILDTPPDFIKEMLISENIPEEEREKYRNKEYLTDKIIDTLLANSGSDIEKNSYEYFAFRELSGQYCSQILDKLSSVFTDNSISRTNLIENVHFSSSPDVSAIPKHKTHTLKHDLSSSPPITLQDAINRYIKESQDLKKWSDATLRAARGALKVLPEHFGRDFNIRSISREQMLELRKILSEIPKNRTKLFSDKSLTEQLELDNTKKISIKTQQNIMTYIIAFFSWCNKPEIKLLDNNVAKGLQIKDESNVKPEERKKIFEPDDLEKILKGLKTLSPNDKNTPSKYWITLIGMFHGMRLNEICQLYISDIIQVNNIPCIDINKYSTAKDKSLKNKSSRRLIPIHSTVLKLGFLDYCEEIRNAGHERLFPELTYTNYSGYSRKISRWFNDKFKKKILGSWDKKDFHSFRGNVATFLAEGNAEKFYKMALLGHAQEGMTEEVYTTARAPKLKEELEKLDYGIDVFGILEKHPLSEERIADKVKQLPSQT
jgi:integrase